MEENNLNNDELNKSFEKDLESAFILNERKALKSLFKNIDTQNEIEEKEIERAFVLNERKRLKEQFKEIEDAEKIEFGDKIGAANYSYKHNSVETQLKNQKSNWKNLKIAASIVGLVALTSIWVIYNNNQVSDLKFSKLNDKEIKNHESIITTQKSEKPFSNQDKNLSHLKEAQKKIENKNEDSLLTIKKTEESGITQVEILNSTVKEIKKLDAKNHYSIQIKSLEKLKIQDAVWGKSYTTTKTINIKKIAQFGFGSNKVEKIKVVNYNIDKQISILKVYETRTLLDSNYYLNNFIKSNIDSITALKNKYSFDLDTLNTYNINSEDIEVYYLDDKYYLRISTSYYELSKSKEPIVLKKLDNWDIIEQLDAL